MHHINIIQKSLDFIEDNLTAEISISELADNAGYSLYHYERIFKKLVGISISQYMKRRRLLHAAFDIASGKRIVDTAYNYGFDTNAGFYKAFIKEFGAAPSEYVAVHAVKRPYPIKLIQEEHILITHDKIKSMLDHWNLASETIADFHDPISGQRIDNTWMVGNYYIMQVGTNLVGLENHISVSRALQAHNFSVSLPLQTVSGQDYVTEGELYFFVSHRVSGACMDDRLLFSEDGIELAYKLGQAVGRLDTTLAGFDFICNEPDLWEQVENRCIPKVKETCSLGDNFFKDLADNMGRLYPALPKQLIHRDPNPGNIIVESGEITGFLDFELTERNIRIFDPCYVATAVLSATYEDDSLDRSKWPNILRAIIAGYDSISHLSQEEKAAIPYVIFCIQLTCIAFFSDFERFHALAETNTKMLEWLIEHFNLLQSII